MKALVHDMLNESRSVTPRTFQNTSISLNSNPRNFTYVVPGSISVDVTANVTEDFRSSISLSE